MCGRVQVLASQPCEIVKVMPKLLWRSENIGDARNVGCPLRKPRCRVGLIQERILCYGHQIWRDGALPSPLGVQMSSLGTPSPKHRSMELRVCCLDLSLFWLFLAIPWVFSFGKGMLTLCHHVLEVCNCRVWHSLGGGGMTWLPTLGQGMGLHECQWLLWHLGFLEGVKIRGWWDRSSLVRSTGCPSREPRITRWLTAVCNCSCRVSGALFLCVHVLHSHNTCTYIKLF